MIRYSLPIAAALTLAACDSGTPPAPVVNEGALAVPAAAPAGPKKLTALPDAFRGKWGGTPADCKGGSGLATIGATTMSFAGVDATVSDIVQVRDDRVTATANYANRKGKWQSPTTMTLQDDGKTLRREDTHPSGMFSYQRCAG